MANNAVVGTLRALLTADTAQFESGMRRASVVTGNFGKTTKATETDAAALTGKMAALGAVAGTIAASVGIQATRALVAFGKEAVNSAGHLVDLREKTGESLTSLQRMQHVADQTGTSLDAMTNAAFMLRTRLAGGGNSVNKALEDLRVVSGQAGLSVRSSADEILSALSRVQDEQERTRLGNLLFGRSFRELAGAVTSGYDDIAKGAVISTDAQIKALSDAGDAWDAFVRDQKTRLRSLLGEALIFRREFQNVINVQATGNLAAGIAEMERRRGTNQLAGTRTTDIELSTKALRGLNTETKALSTNLTKTEDAAAKAATAQRAFINALGEREIEDAAKALEALEGAERAHRQFLNQIGEQEIADHAAALQQQAEDERAYRQFQNQLGEEFIREEERRLQQQQEQARRLKEFWMRQAEQIGQAFTGGFATLFAGGLNRKIGDEMRQFSTRWKQWADNLLRTFIGVLDQMVQHFLTSFLGGLIRGLAGSRLGQALGSAISGGAAGAALGGGASFVASSVAGVEAAALGGGAGAGGGAGLAALATNPFTIAAAGAIGLGFLIGKKGVFRGGEEALHVNPRRDQFIAQFGSHHGLAARLTAAGAGHGGGALLAALNVADTVKEFEAAQSAIAGFLGKDVRLFNLGGFVPPGVVQPAILHGGTHGEVVTPLGRGGAPMIVNINANIKAWDVRDVKAAFRDQIIPETKQALLLNTDGLTTAIQRHALGGRR